MDEKTFRKTIEDLPLGEARYLASTGSTNDLALAWATEGVPDFSIVFADQQTSGRGRQGRRWHTPAGSGLAFSIILRPAKEEHARVALYSGLGALAVCKVLQAAGLQAQIKWPNDVLVAGRKVAGILTEAVWTGEALDSLVIGIGLNVLQAALPPAGETSFPATSLEGQAGPTDRAALLHDLLAAVAALRPEIGSEDFLAAWEAALAFRGEQVYVWRDQGEGLTGTLNGLGPDGSLELGLADGRSESINYGEVHLRPAETA